MMPRTPAKSLTVAAHAVFVPAGLMTVLLGPLLPSLSSRWALTDAQAGFLFTVQFAASTLGVAISGWLIYRLGFRSAIIAGLLPMAVGVSALPANSRYAGISGIALYGIGLGLTIPSGNLLVAEVNPHRRGAALNLLNFSWSVGAVACPFLIGAALVRKELPVLLYSVAASMLFILALIVRMPAWRDYVPGIATEEKQRELTTDRHDFSYVVFSGLFFLYVGIENAVGGWAASYAKHIAAASPYTVMTPSFFYIALMAGRWLAPLWLRKMTETNVARAGLGCACLGMLGLVATRTMSGVIGSVVVTGFGLSAVYPITISLLSHRFESAASRVGSLMFTMANLGGASLPWLVGYCSTVFSNLKIGLAVPLIAGLLMLTLYLQDRMSSLVSKQS